MTRETETETGEAREKVRDGAGEGKKNERERESGGREGELLAVQTRRKKCAFIVISSGSTPMLRRLQFLLKNSVHRVPPAARVQSTGTREICYRC